MPPDILCERYEEPRGILMPSDLDTPRILDMAGLQRDMPMVPAWNVPKRLGQRLPGIEVSFDRAGSR